MREYVREQVQTEQKQHFKKRYYLYKINHIILKVYVYLYFLLLDSPQFQM